MKKRLLILIIALGLVTVVKAEKDVENIIQQVIQQSQFNTEDNQKQSTDTETKEETKTEDDKEEERAEGRTSRKSMKRLGNLSHAGSPRKTDPNVQKIWKKKSGTGREV